MASRCGITTKPFPTTLGWLALLPILLTVQYIAFCFYSVVINHGDNPWSQVCIGASPCPRRGESMPWVESMTGWIGKGTDHGVDLCVSPSRLTGRWRCPRSYLLKKTVEEVARLPLPPLGGFLCSLYCFLPGMKSNPFVCRNNSVHLKPIPVHSANETWEPLKIISDRAINK